ncbi:putative quinol monooxygenase [Parasedimentitalea maritima]|nr:antibiotic biosynthesis monooxygenase family protein [Zongyanglinia marina]
MFPAHIVHVTLTPDPAQLATFHTAMEGVQASLPQVSGCEGVRVLRTEGSTPHYILVEDWQSQIQHQAHLDALIASGEWAKLKSMLSQPPQSWVLSKV